MARRAATIAAVALLACAVQRRDAALADAPRASRAIASERARAPRPLTTGFAELRARFDADSGRARLLVLASPT